MSKYARRYRRIAGHKNTMLKGGPRCPGCGELVDGAVAPGAKEATPKPGDVTVCGYCLQPSQFEQSPDHDDQLRLRKLDVSQLPPDARAELQRVVDLLKAYPPPKGYYR